MKLTGLSLSFCIKDILNGLVLIVDVDKIITNTALDNILDILSDEYCYLEGYWKGHSKEEVRLVLEQLTIEQPKKNTNHSHHSISQGHWMTDFEGFRNKDECDEFSDYIPIGNYYDPNEFAKACEVEK